MRTRSRCSAFAGAVLLSTGVASAQPSYCPSANPPTPCGQAQIGDLLVTLHGPDARVIGLNPWTRQYYVFSEALQALQSTELGDIAVLPSNPVETVVIGNVDDNHQVGLRRLDACGNLAPAQYGTFPAQWPLPWISIQRQGTNNRGVVFNPLDAQLFSPGPIASFLYDPYQTPFGSIFRFPVGGGDATLLAATGSLVNPTVRGAVAADEFGNLYLGETTGDGKLSKIPGTSLIQQSPVELAAGTFPLFRVHDLVHDGNNHLYVTDYDNWEDDGHVYRFNTATGRPEVWTWDFDAASGNPFNELFGIAIDAWGDLWVIEDHSAESNRAGLVKISGQTGQVLDYYPFPAPLFGTPIHTAQPFGLAVYGVNPPAIRERCAGTCGDGQIMDCYGACLPADYLGDSICDAGPSNSLNCYARGFDGNACNPCPEGQLPDCHGTCGPKSWLGDGTCDDGFYVWNGSPIDFDCRESRYDEGACQTCNPGEVQDCNGNCAPGNWLGDSVCDAGGWIYNGAAIDFACVEHDFDQGTCQ
jgi:hypothetical protein